MTENPYQPPPGDAASVDRARPRWYQTQPSDWESTAAAGWLLAVAALLWTGFAPLPLRGVESVATERGIPGPEVIGGLAYFALALLLAVVPAVLCGALHAAAMQLSPHPLYRRLLGSLAKFLTVVLTVVIAGLGQLLIIR